MKIKENIYIWLAWHIPNAVVMWCFIRVMSVGWAATNKTPDEVTYSEAYNAFMKKQNLDERDF